MCGDVKAVQVFEEIGGNFIPEGAFRILDAGGEIEDEIVRRIAPEDFLSPAFAAAAFRLVGEDADDFMRSGILPLSRIVAKIPPNVNTS